ncbi:MAG: M48 family metalloprotease [Balneolaceae bacterium]|nr:M48 family metalloprotease [Balneolaceae bacterium]
MLKKRVFTWSVALIVPLMVVAACVVQRSPVTGTNRAYGYSWEEEKKLGAQADQQIQQQYGVYQNEELLNYVKNVGQSVLQVSHMRREGTQEKYRETEFHFRVLNSPIVNAFALPGGYVYVTRGLLSHIENEAQLAVVLGHEIGHVAARHASQRAFEQKIGQIALLGGAIAGQEIFGLPGQSILDLGGAAAQLLFLQYSRDDERESDRLGVEYSAMKNYRASEGAEFFGVLERMSERSGQSIPSFLQTHPDPGERAKTIPELARQWEQKGYNLTITDTEEYMNTIDGMVYGDNPREGFTRGGTFYHPDLKFQFPYPTDWTLVNQATQVVIFNKNQDAVMVLKIDAEAESPRTSVVSFTAQQGITVLSQSETSSDGLNAYEATASATMQGGEELRLYVFAVEYDGNIYRFVTYTTAAQFDSYKTDFVNSTNNFRELNDPEILNIRPVRLHIRRADRAATFKSFLPDNLPMDITAEEVAIANQVGLDDTIEEGTFLKIPVQ